MRELGLVDRIIIRFVSIFPSNSLLFKQDRTQGYCLSLFLTHFMVNPCARPSATLKDSMHLRTQIFHITPSKQTLARPP
jgi:hypothetical protein